MGFAISVVIPVYNEEDQIFENVCLIRECLVKNGISHEIIMVDDGSTDNTWYAIKSLLEKIPQTCAVRLSRNFGKEAAICAGLERAEGDACVIMDADLQHPPHIIPEMVRLWQEGFEVVEAVKTSRGKEPFAKKASSTVFYSLMKKFSGIDLKGASDYKLLDRKVVCALRAMKERDTFFRGMSAWTGFNRVSLPFNVAERKKGNSKWPMLKLVKLAVTAITSFSAAPLQIVTFLGLIFLTGSFFLGIQTLYKKMAGISLDGFTTVILLLLIIGSTLMISLGIIGTYIARIFDEVKGRPRYLISEMLRSGKETQPPAKTCEKVGGV